MITLDSPQTTAVASATKAVLWLFEVTPVGQPLLRWSTQDVTWGGNPYFFMIRPGSFHGVTMHRSRTEINRLPMPEAQFIATNAITVPYASTYFDNATVVIRLVINTVEVRTWKMVVTACSNGFKSLAFECEGFLKKHLRGDLPKTTKVKRLDPTYTGNDDDCVPLIYGTGYVPLPCILDNNARNYLLGDTDLSQTYTITAVHAGYDWPSRTSEWLSTSYTFTQLAMSVGSYRLVQPKINDIYGDGSSYATGLSPDDMFRPICAKYTCSRTSSITNPANVINDILLSIGVSAGDISLGTSATDFTTRGITWNGGWTKRQSAESFLSQLLSECHAEIDVRDKVYLRVSSATSVTTIGSGDVLRNNDISTWSYSAMVKPEFDSGHFSWSATGTPDDVRLTAIMAADASTANPGFETFAMSMVHDSVIAQKLACLRYQRILLDVGVPSWTAPLARLAIQPGDVVTINHNDYGAAGGTYKIIIDEMTINREGTIRFAGLRLSRMDDWADLSFSSVTIPSGAEEPSILPPHITDLQNPDILTRSEKLAIQGEFNGFTAEKPILEARATSAGVTTEKTAYTEAYTALYDIVGTILSTGLLALKSPITGTAYRTAWTNYKSAKATLLSAITAADATMANWETVASKPENVAVLVGTEPIQNSLITTTTLGAETVVNSDAKVAAITVNLADPKVWAVGTSGAQGAFATYSTGTYNRIVLGVGPEGNTEPLWEGDSYISAGVVSGFLLDFAVDHTKTYRLTVWVKRTGSMDGTTYFGCMNGTGTAALGDPGTPNTNPYFKYFDPPELDQWYLMVGIIHGSGYLLTTPSGVGGIFDPRTGKMVETGTDFKIVAGTTTQRIRALLSICAEATAKQYYCRPRVDEINGNEPTLTSLYPGIVASRVKTGKVLSSDTLTYFDLDNNTVVLGGKTSYSSTVSGVFMGLDGGAYKINIGDATSYMKWSPSGGWVVNSVGGASKLRCQSDYVSWDDPKPGASEIMAGKYEPSAGVEKAFSGIHSYKEGDTPGYGDHIALISLDGQSIVGRVRISTGAGGVANTLDAGSSLIFSLSKTGEMWSKSYTAEEEISAPNLTATVDNIAALRLMAPVADKSVQPKGYTTPGDGGGGPPRIGKTGAAPGTYVDNGGSVIVPTSGDGSAAWIWEWSGPINVKWFGAKGDNATDDSPAVVKAIALVESGQTSNYSGLRQNPTIVFDPDNVFLISQSIYFTGLNNVHFEATGAIIRSTVAGRAFDMYNNNYVTWNGGALVVDNDASIETCFFYFRRTKFSTFQNFNITGSSSANLVNASGIIIDWNESANDITGYNKFHDIRLVRVNTGLIIRDTYTAYKMASRANWNTFDGMIFNCRIGVSLEGASANIIEGDFECETTQYRIVAGAGGIDSLGNSIVVSYMEGATKAIIEGNSFSNRIINLRGTSTTNPDLGTTGNGVGVCLNTANELLDPSVGGIRFAQRGVDLPQNYGGNSGYNLIENSGDFSTWNKVSATVSQNLTLKDPDGGLNAYDINLSADAGYIYSSNTIFSHTIASSFRDRQISARVWMYSDVAGFAKVIMKIAARKHIYRTVPLVAGQWVPVQLGNFGVSGIAGADDIRLEIYPNYSGGALSKLTVYEAGIYSGFPHGHNRTVGGGLPRGPINSHKADNAMYRTIWLSGEVLHNVARKYTIGDAAPTTGEWYRGDKVWHRNPTAGGFEGWVCVSGDGTGVGTWKEFGTIAS